MRAGLDDNAREAFQFLMIGAGLTLLGRAIYWAAFRFWRTSTDPIIADAAEAFQDGYLVGGEVLVAAASGIGGRLALAGVATVVIASMTAALAGVVARLTGAAVPLSHAVRWARIGIVLVAFWGLYAALFLPPRSSHVRPEGLLVQERPALLGTLALPWPAQEATMAWDHLGQAHAHAMMAPAAGCGTELHVMVDHSGGQRTIAALSPGGRDCSMALAQARSDADRLIAALEAYRRASAR